MLININYQTYEITVFLNLPYPRNFVQYLSRNFQCTEFGHPIGSLSGNLSVQSLDLVTL